jgi:hypothetical protein
MLALLLKYLIEGLAVGIAAALIPKKSVSTTEIIVIGLSAAATFALLDIFAPSVGDGARKGAGFGLGAQTVGWPMERFEDAPKKEEKAEKKAEKEEKKEEKEEKKETFVDDSTEDSTESTETTETFESGSMDAPVAAAKKIAEKFEAAQIQGFDAMKNYSAY